MQNNIELNLNQEDNINSSKSLVKKEILNLK